MRDWFLGLSLVALVVVPGPSDEITSADTGQVESSTGSHSEPPISMSVASQLDFRKSLGLSADPEFVSSLQDNPGAVLADTGLWVTESEAKELEARARLETDYEALRTAVGGRAEFGGMYVDNERGELVLLSTSDGVGHITNLVSDVALLEPQRLRIEVVEFSLPQLLAAHNAVETLTLTEGAVTSYAVSELQNRVIVTVDPVELGLTSSDDPIAKEGLPSTLADGLSDPAILVWAFDIVDTPSTTMVGGFSWNNSGTAGDKRCTLGFEISDNSVGAAMITAGHCLDNDPVSEPNTGDSVFFTNQHIGWFQGEYKLGCSTNAGTCVDAGVLEMISAATATDNVRSGAGDLDVAGTTLNYGLGLQRCFYGWNSGPSCGTITCSSVNYQSAGGRWYRDMFATSNTNLGGDSGSPVYRILGSSAYATGILRGVGTNPCWVGTDGIHSKIDNVLAALGATLITTG